MTRRGFLKFMTFAAGAVATGGFTLSAPVREAIAAVHGEPEHDDWIKDEVIGWDCTFKQLEQIGVKEWTAKRRVHVRHRTIPPFDLAHNGVSYQRYSYDSFGRRAWYVRK